MSEIQKCLWNQYTHCRIPLYYLRGFNFVDSTCTSHPLIFFYNELLGTVFIQMYHMCKRIHGVVAFNEPSTIHTQKKPPYAYLNECLPFQVTAWSTLATQTQSWMVCHSVPWTEIMTGTVVTVPLSTVGDGGSTTVMTPILTDRGPLTTGTSLGTPL